MYRARAAGDEGRNVSMGDLAQTQKRFILWLTVMAVLNVGFLVYLLWPGARGPQPEALQAQNTFSASNLATRQSQISQEVEKLLRENGVTTQAIKYDFSKGSDKNPPPPGVQLVRVDTVITGDYPKIAKFVNAMEQSKLLFIIDGISLSNQEGGTVTLQISFDTFLKEAA